GSALQVGGCVGNVEVGSQPLPCNSGKIRSRDFQVRTRREEVVASESTRRLHFGDDWEALDAGGRLKHVTRCINMILGAIGCVPIYCIAGHVEVNRPLIGGWRPPAKRERSRAGRVVLYELHRETGWAVARASSRDVVIAQHKHSGSGIVGEPSRLRG